MIFKKVTQHFLFNIYTITKEIDTFVAFETMNNRGKLLSNLELLKNRLIYLSTKFKNDDEENRKALRRKINDTWRAIYYYLGKDKSKRLSDDSFLSAHTLINFGLEMASTVPEFATRHHRDWHVLRAKFGHNYERYLLEDRFTIKNILEPIDKPLTITSLNEYVDSLIPAVKGWYSISSPEIDESITSFDERRYLSCLDRLDYTWNRPFLLAVRLKVQQTAKRVAIFKVAERIFFGISVCGHRFGWQLDLVGLGLELMADRVTADEVLNRMTETLAYVSDNKYTELVKETFRSGFYGWDQLSYFMYEYEEYLRSESRTKRQKLHWDTLTEPRDEYKTVEHIYPLTPANPCWDGPFKKITAHRKKKLQNSLGNLLPLSKPKNSSLGNKCFKDKKASRTGKVGYAYGCYSENEVALLENWGPKEILNRGIKLLDFMELRWGFNLGDNVMKKSILQLEFLED